jgi:hypothetical protein
MEDVRVRIPATLFLSRLISTVSWCFLGQKGVEAVDGGVGAVVEEAAVAGEGEGDAVVAGPFGNSADIAARRRP